MLSITVVFFPAGNDKHCDDIMFCFWRLFTGQWWCHGPLIKYVEFRVAHAPGIPGTFSSPPRVNDPRMHHGTCVRHVPWRMPGSLTSGCIWSRWRGKRSRHSRRTHNPQFTYLARGPCISIQCRWPVFWRHHMEKLSTLQTFCEGHRSRFLSQRASNAELYFFLS